MALTLFRDEGDTFKAQITVEGASLANSRARLVLEFDQGKTYLLRGDVSDNGDVEILIPRMEENEGAQGRATLEVIADNAFFEPWNGQFTLKSRKNVSADDVRVQEKKNARVSVVNVFNADEPKKPVERFTEKATSMQKRTVNQILKMLDESVELEDIEISANVRDWVKDVMVDTESREAQFVMQRLEQKLTAGNN